MLTAGVANAKLTELRAVLASRSLPNLLCCSVLEDEEGADAMRSLDALLREPDVATYGAAAVAAMFGVIHHARLCGLLKDDLRNCADVDGLITFLRVFGTGRLHLFILALGCHQPVDIREFACGLRLLACEVHGDRFDPEDKHMGRSDFSNMQERIDEIVVATHEQHVDNGKVSRSPEVILYCQHVASGAGQRRTAPLQRIYGPVRGLGGPNRPARQSKLVLERFSRRACAAAAGARARGGERCPVYLYLPEVAM
jgi:hypothetical protein